MTNTSPLSQGTIVSAFAAKEPAQRATQSIGAILIDAGRITPENAETILRVQREHGLQFGDAAIQLGLLSRADIEYALSRQFDYPYLVKGDSHLSEELIAAYAPFSPQVEALRTLRSQLMLRWFDNQPNHKSLAIASPETGEGCSFIAANLAIVFSQLGERTLLIDANMRDPRSHKLFGLENRSGLSAILSEREGLGAIPPNPHELLSRVFFLKLLADVSRDYDIVLIDTPAGSTFPDAHTVGGRAGAALVVARKNISQVEKLRHLADGLTQANAVIVGTVLNEF